MFRRVAVSLTIFNAAVIVVILAVSGLATYFAVQYVLSARTTRDLEQAAAAFRRSETFLTTYGNADLRGIKELGEEGIATVASFPVLMFNAQGGRFDGSVTASDELSHDDDDDEAQELIGAAKHGFTAAVSKGRPDLRSVQLEDKPVRALSAPVTRGEEIVGVIQVFASEKEQRELLGVLRLSLLAVGLVGALVAVIGGYVLSSRALVPVRSAFSRQRDFIAGASHQLRTPAAIIRADAEALDRLLPDLGPEDRQILRDMVREVDFLSNVIRQLIAAARLEGPTEVFTRERLDITFLVRETTDAISALARERQIEVSVQVPEPPLYVLGDGTQLRLALIGLLDNAVKYNRHRGSIEVVVVADGEWVEIVVSDAGEGLTEEDALRVFERFFRGKNARDRSIEGAGLGLTIARQVAQAHDGDATISTKRGQGTTITLRLPALQS